MMRRCETETNFINQYNAFEEIDNLCKEMDYLCHYIDDVYVFDEETKKGTNDIKEKYEKIENEVTLKYENKKKDLENNLFIKYFDKIESKIEHLEKKITQYIAPYERGDYFRNQFLDSFEYYQWVYEKYKINSCQDYIEKWANLRDIKNIYERRKESIINKTYEKYCLIKKEIDKEKKKEIDFYKDERRKKRKTLIIKNKKKLNRYSKNKTNEDIEYLDLKNL